MTRKKWNDQEYAVGACLGVVLGFCFGGMIGLGIGLMTLGVAQAIGLSILCAAVSFPVGYILAATWMAWVARNG